MKLNDLEMDLYLRPAEYYFGNEVKTIRTVLGSCVAITVWHPGIGIGGMCHYVLPSRPPRLKGSPDPRYADDALALLIEGMLRAKTRPEDYEVKVFGGGNMFAGGEQGKTDHVGRRNSEVAMELLRQKNLNCLAWDVGGNGHRNVVFDLQTGGVWVRWSPSASGVADNGEGWAHRSK